MKYSISVFLALICIAGKTAANHRSFIFNPATIKTVADSSLPFSHPPGRPSAALNSYEHRTENAFMELITLFALDSVEGASVTFKGVAGRSVKGRPVEAYYFPGTSGKRAMVIGGVHGSELSSIAVANKLLEQIQRGKPLFYSVLVIPVLFPDNMALALDHPFEIGSTLNIGRYSGTCSPDPNRQMPSLGKHFDAKNPVDHLGRHIEEENKLLLECIERFRPERIVNIHAIRNAAKAGVYADPRTDHYGYALGFESDSSLAVEMAKYIAIGGGQVGGNRLDSLPTALYPYDPSAALSGECQKRNLTGSALPGNRGHGVSLGAWASTAVNDPAAPSGNRPAIRLITMEFPGNKRPDDYLETRQQNHCRQQVGLYASAILEIFLADTYAAETSPAL